MTGNLIRFNPIPSTVHALTTKGNLILFSTISITCPYNKGQPHPVQHHIYYMPIQQRATSSCSAPYLLHALTTKGNLTLYSTISITCPYNKGQAHPFQHHIYNMPLQQRASSPCSAPYLLHALTTKGNLILFSTISITSYLILSFITRRQWIKYFVCTWNAAYLQNMD